MVVQVVSLGAYELLLYEPVRATRRRLGERNDPARCLRYHGPRTLWLSDLVTPEELTPVAILRQQAGILTEKTRGLVAGRIDTYYYPEPRLVDPAGVPPDFLVLAAEVGKSLKYDAVISHHEFILVVPALGGYEHELLSVEHDESNFPLVVVSDEVGGYNVCPSLANFYNTLKNFMNSRKSILVIKTLAARASGRRPVVGPNGDIVPL